MSLCVSVIVFFSVSYCFTAPVANKGIYYPQLRRRLCDTYCLCVCERDKLNSSRELISTKWLNFGHPQLTTGGRSLSLGLILDPPCTLVQFDLLQQPNLMSHNGVARANRVDIFPESPREAGWSLSRNNDCSSFQFLI